MLHKTMIVLKMWLKTARSLAIHYVKKGYHIVKENPIIVVSVLVACIVVFSALALSTSLVRSFISTPGCIILYLVLFVLFVRLVIRSLVFPGSTTLWRKKLESTYRVGKKLYYMSLLCRVLMSYNTKNHPKL